MLVLTRRIGEAINIGDDIKVTILTIERCKIRISVNAPKDIIIHREKNCLQNLRANQQTLKQQKLHNS